MVEKNNRVINLVAYTHCGSGWVNDCFIERNIVTGSTPSYLDYVKAHRNRLTCFNPNYPQEKLNGRLLVKDGIYVNLLFHFLPTKAQAFNSKTVVFIRDPRDAIWSQFKSEVDADTKEFSEAVYKIDLPSAWRYFNEYCLALPNTKFFRFEDYKENPLQTLKNIFSFCEVECSHEEMVDIITHTSFERLKQGEEIYLKQQAAKGQQLAPVYARSGKIGQWRDLPQHAELFEVIKERAYPVMKIFNYV